MRSAFLYAIAIAGFGADTWGSSALADAQSLPVTSGQDLSPHFVHQASDDHHSLPSVPHVKGRMGMMHSMKMTGNKGVKGSSKTARPTRLWTAHPTPKPILPGKRTGGPTRKPTKAPAVTSFVPVQIPSAPPFKIPTNVPSLAPSRVPSKVPSKVPSAVPSNAPVMMSCTRRARANRRC